MQSETPKASVSKVALWTGYILSALVVLTLFMSGIMKLTKSEDVTKGFADLGWPADRALFLACLELASAVLYLIPRTSTLGAVLITGYLGGATATHARIGDPFIPPIILGVLAWLGLYLRDTRVRDLLPLRKNPCAVCTPRSGILPVLGKIVLVLVVIVVVFLGIAHVQPTDFRLTRSATIAAPPSEVFPYVNDFHKWDAWSPWSKLDPNAKNTFEGPPAGTGAVFKWSGNSEVGEGMMKIADSKPNELVKIKLDFIKPFEDTANTEFTFKPAGNQTVVTWDMSGERGLLSKVFCLFVNMDKMVGGEFEKGLANMKAAVEGANKK